MPTLTRANADNTERFKTLAQIFLKSCCQHSHLFLGDKIYLWFCTDTRKVNAVNKSECYPIVAPTHKTTKCHFQVNSGVQVVELLMAHAVKLMLYRLRLVHINVTLNQKEIYNQLHQLDIQLYQQRWQKERNHIKSTQWLQVFDSTALTGLSNKARQIILPWSCNPIVLFFRHSGPRPPSNNSKFNWRIEGLMSKKECDIYPKTWHTFETRKLH